ncbi:MAG: hypothetical protein ACI9UN_004779 [Granulosicoccus sp.]|jgi:hypothetical protein
MNKWAASIIHPNDQTAINAVAIVNQRCRTIIYIATGPNQKTTKGFVII